MRHVMTCLFLLAVFAVGCDKSHRGAKRGTLEERLPKAEVVPPGKLRKDKLVRTVELSATVEALWKVDLSARVPGVVSQISPGMDIGRKVRKGEVLLKLSVPDLEADRMHKSALASQARKSVTLARESLAVALREVDEVEKDDKKFKAEALFAGQRLDRIKELVRQRAQDVTVQQEAERGYEAAEAARESNLARKAKREASVKAAEAQLELDTQKVAVADAELKKAEAQLAFATVLAPFDGVVTKRWVDPGAMIKDPGAVLLTVMDLSSVRVLIDVPQRDVPLLNDDENSPNPKTGKGDDVRVTLPILGEKVAGGRFHGTVTRVGRSLDPVTRTMRAEILLPNVKGYLQPGMFGTASVTVEQRENVLTVPASALVRKGEGEVEVFIVANPTGEGEVRRGVLQRVKVELGIDDGKEVEIRSGLTGNELVVARGASVMRDGDEVLAIDAP